MREHSLIQVVLACLLSIAPIIMFAWTFRPKSIFDKFDWGYKGNALKQVCAIIIACFAFFGLWRIILKGYESLFSFLPSWWWAKSEFGDHTSSYAQFTSGFLGCIGALLIFFLLIDRNGKRRAILHDKGQIQ